MALKKELALMATTSALRMGAGLIALSMVARTLGPTEFGVLALWISVSALTTVLTNYGMTPYILKEAAANPAGARCIIAEAFGGKLVLTIPVLISTAITVVVCSQTPAIVITMLMVAALADCFSEFFSAGFRAVKRYEVETKIATVGSISHAVIVAGMVLAFRTVEAAAMGYGLSRSVNLALTMKIACNIFGPLPLPSWKAIAIRLHSASAYALDFALQSLFGQVDSLILNSMVGLRAAGIHQAGMRVYQVGAQAAPILANVFLPRASAAGGSGYREANEVRRIQLTYLGVGAFFGLGMAILAEPVVQILFGRQYNGLIELLPLFGFLFYLRFVSGAWGILLTAAGMQNQRTIISLVHWSLVALAAWHLVPTYGNFGWLSSLCIGSGAQAAIYAVACRNVIDRNSIYIACAAAGMLLFAPFIPVGQ